MNIQQETINKETGEVQEQPVVENSSTADKIIESMPQDNFNYALEILESIGVDSKYWDKEFPIEESDVVAIYVGDATFQGKVQKFDNGEIKKNVLLEVVNEFGHVQFVSATQGSSVLSTLQRMCKLHALKNEVGVSSIAYLLGKKINLSCFNYVEVQAAKAKDQKLAYIFKGEIIGEATHKVKDVYSLDV